MKYTPEDSKLYINNEEVINWKERAEQAEARVISLIKGNLTREVEIACLTSKCERLRNALVQIDNCVESDPYACDKITEEVQKIAKNALGSL